MKLKGLHFADVADIQEDVTDELRRSKKRNFGSFSETVRPRKSLFVYASGAYFEFLKKVYIRMFLMCPRFLT